jgi:hypothetical protein
MRKGLRGGRVNTKLLVEENDHRGWKNGGKEEVSDCVYQNGIVFQAFVGICMERFAWG